MLAASAYGYRLRMIDLMEDARVWPDVLRPVNDDSFDKEPFGTWLDRNRANLPDLPEPVLEQWVYRHFRHSPFQLPLDRLSGRLERWDTAHVLAAVKTADDWHPDFDLEQLSRHWGRDMTVRGTWTMPPIVLRAPNGFARRGHSWPGPAYALIEGHRRMRMLNALEHVGQAGPVHEMYVLTLAD
jgi:hypothetical protein